MTTPALLAATGNIGGAAANVRTYTMTQPAAGSLVVVQVVSCSGGAARDLTLTDDFGHTWSRVFAEDIVYATPNWRVSYFYLWNAPASSSPWTLSLAMPAGAEASLVGVAASFSGVRTSSDPLLTSGKAAAQGVTSLTASTDAALTEDNALLLAAIGVEAFSGAAIATPSGWTSLLTQNAWAYPTQVPAGIAYKTSGTSRAVQSAAWSFASGTALAFIAAFAADVAAGPRPTLSKPLLLVEGNDLTASGSFALSAAFVSASAQIIDQAGAVLATQSPAVSGTDYSTTFNNQGGGTLSARVTITDANGATTAVSDAKNIALATADSTLDWVYVSSQIAPDPVSVSIRPSASGKLYVLDQNGVFCQGVTAVAAETGVATTTTPTDANGAITITGVAVGTTTIALAWTNEAGVTLTGTLAVSVSASALVAPTIAVTPRPSGATVAVNDSNAGAATYAIQYARSPQGPWKSAGTLASGTLSVVIGNLPAVPHYFRARAVSGLAHSVYSPIVSATPSTPVITTASLGTFIAGVASELQLTADQPVTWSLAANPTPPVGVSLSADGLLRVNVANPVSTPITVQAAGQAGAVGATTFTLNVVSGSVPTISPASLPQFVAGVAATVPLGANQAVTWALESPPAGFSINATSGVLSVSVASAGSGTLTVKATNGQGLVGTKVYSYTIRGSALDEAAPVSASRITPEAISGAFKVSR